MPMYSFIKLNHTIVVPLDLNLFLWLFCFERVSKHVFSVLFFFSKTYRGLLLKTVDFFANDIISVLKLVSKTCN